MPALIDERGNRYGRWSVIERASSSGKGAKWVCRCDCGETRAVVGDNLRAGLSRSCGCLQLEEAVQRIKHGHTHRGDWHPLYRTWANMLQRCGNENNTDYSHYGGRGIRVCEQWACSFQAFLDGVGERPSPEYTLDRINNDGNYEPGNVRWATRKQQSNNQRPRRKRK